MASSYASSATSMLSSYLHRIGLASPADAAQQLQLALLQQWVAHLGEALEAEHVAPAVASRVIRSFIYGAMPQRADAELRVLLSDRQIAHLTSCADPKCHARVL